MSNYGAPQQVGESITTKNKDKIYTSYNYQSNNPNSDAIGISVLQQSVHQIAPG